MRVGGTYRAYVRVNSIAKAVSAGLGAAFVEIDFDDREPNHCDEGLGFPKKGVNIDDAALRLRPMP